MSFLWLHVIKKTKLSTITAALATMVVIATLGTIGAVGQQQIAFAEELDLERLLELSEELEDLDEKIIEELTSSIANNPLCGLRLICPILFD